MIIRDVQVVCTSERLQRAQCKAGQFALIKLQREAGASVLSPVCSLIPFARSCRRWEVQRGLRWPVPPALSQPCPASLNLPPGPPLHGELIANDL